MQRYFISFVIFLGLAWGLGCAREEADMELLPQTEKTIEEVEEEEVLQAGGQAPRLALYKDSVYSTLYHAELMTPMSLIKTGRGIQWEVRGGRYHIYEEEMPLFKALRPFQRTLLFLEKTKYDVFVTFNRQGDIQETNHIEIDVSSVTQPLLKSEIEMDKLSAFPGEAIKLHARVETLEEFQDQWNVKRIQKVKCPSLDDVLPEAIQSELTTISEICDRSYEEELTQNKDYVLEKGKMSHEIEVTFKSSGHYVITFWGYGDQGQLLSKSSRKIVLEGAMVSQR